MGTIKTFKDQASYDIFRNERTKNARRRLPVELWRKAQKILNALNNAEKPEDVKRYNLDKKRGDREGQFSLRINRQYRICFRWIEGSAEYVEIIDYHDN